MTAAMDKNFFMAVGQNCNAGASDGKSFREKSECGHAPFFTSEGRISPDSCHFDACGSPDAMLIRVIES
jgi:hypothetical protein